MNKTFNFASFYFKKKMSTLKHLFLMKKFSLRVYECRGYFKYYSNTSPKNAIFKNLNNPNFNIDTKYTSQKKFHFHEKKNEKSNEYLTLHKVNNAKENELNGNNKHSISLSIVGGGCATIYTTILLKQSSLIKEIRLIDTDDSLIGSVCDLKQLDTSPGIKYFKKSSILDGLRNSDIVAVMDETHFTMGNKGPFSQFVSSCNYVKVVAEGIVHSCPNAVTAVFVHPVTAMLPLITEIFKQSGNWDPNKVIGSAALESMRIAALTAAVLDLNPSFLSVPMTGGVDPLTIVPLLSRTIPFNDISTEDQCMLIHQLRSADKYLFECETKGPTISTGIAAAKFISMLINGLKGQSISIANAYIRADILPSCHYMTSQLKFGPNGVEHNFGIPKVSSREISLIEQAIPMMNKIVNTVNHFVHYGKIK